MSSLIAPTRTESPLVRGPLWVSLQVVIQALFCFWLGYRATGHKRLATENGALILANHQSFLDPLVVGLPLRRPISFLARDSLFRAPLVGWILKNTYVMPINQQATSTVSLRDTIRRLHEGWLVGIFPEGTRSPDGTLGQMKPGFAAVVRRAKMPVYPVGISGAHQALPLGGWFIKPCRVRVVFGEPLTVEELEKYSHRDQEAELVELVRMRIAACCAAADSWRQTGQPPQPNANDV
jgi:1-acyl-sn-glycerol-3-phosphate acyltransferase